MTAPGACLLLCLTAGPLATEPAEPDPVVGVAEPETLALEPPAALPAAAPRDAGEREWRLKLEQILARREFRAARRGSGLEPRWNMFSFGAWFEEQLRWLGELVREWLRGLWRRAPGGASEGTLGSISQPATWALAAAAAALLGLLLQRALRNRRAQRAVAIDATIAAPAAVALPDALSQPADVWARFAEEFARSGELRLALRALYLRLLALLHERGAIRYERQRTNGDYVRALAGAPAGEPFRRLTLCFDLAWYGNKPFERADYEAALDAVRAVDRATAGAEARP